MKIKDIVTDSKLYPRSHTNHYTSSRYYNALRAGAIFPPISVAKKGGKYILIDGAHRIEALKGIKEQFVQAEIYEGLTDEEIYLKSIELNSAHGKPFETFEVVEIARRLREEFHMSSEQVSEIIRIPADEIDNFVAKRMTRIVGTGEAVVLKKPLYDFAGVSLPSDTKIPEGQKSLDGQAQIKLVDSLITLIRNDWVENSEYLEQKLKRLYKLLDNKYGN